MQILKLWLKQIFGLDKSSPKKRIHFNNAEEALHFAIKLNDTDPVPGAAYPAIIRKQWRGQDAYGRPRFIVDLPGLEEVDYTIGTPHPYLVEDLNEEDFVLVGITEVGTAEVIAKLNTCFDLARLEWERAA